MPFSLAISPCPNDTFAFFGLLHGKTGYREPLETRFADIEKLNRSCIRGEVDFCKISFFAYALTREQYLLLDAGSALGFGRGPLLVAKTGLQSRRLATRTIAIPGRYTTATMLLKLYLGRDLNLVEMPYDQIMPAVASGEVDAGLIIHESRFTYGRHGLVSLVDLGAWWEKNHGLPIPLGGIVAHKKLPQSRIAEFDRALGKSIDYGWEFPEETLPFMREHAREMEPRVIREHVDLYVNRFTRSLGEEGKAAVDRLIREAQKKGLCQI